MEMRLIDADAYIKYCDENWIPLNVDAVNAQPTIDDVQCKKCKFNSTEDSYHKLVELPISETSYYDCGEIKVINELPTINAVPVVKCRDCKFNYANYIPGEDSCFKFTDLPISKDFYCACGEIFID